MLECVSGRGVGWGARPGTGKRRLTPSYLGQNGERLPGCPRGFGCVVVSASPVPSPNVRRVRVGTCPLQPRRRRGLRGAWVFGHAAGVQHLGMLAAFNSGSQVRATGRPLPRGSRATWTGLDGRTAGCTLPFQAGGRRPYSRPVCCRPRVFLRGVRDRCLRRPRPQEPTEISGGPHRSSLLLVWYFKGAHCLSVSTAEARCLLVHGG